MFADNSDLNNLLRKAMNAKSRVVIPNSPLISIFCVKRSNSQLIDIRRVEAITVSESPHKGSLITDSFNDVGLYMYSGNVVHVTLPTEKLEVLQSAFSYYQNKPKGSVPPMPAPTGSNIQR